jgi:hypothetical protein
MDINERIKEIEPYFKSLNMVDGTTVILVKFPDKWKIFNAEELTETYNVYTGKKENVDGIFFLSETSNGVDCIFDAIEEVINQNKTFEEKAALLEIRAKELSDLFLTEPLEKLRTLEFTFPAKKSTRKPKLTLKEVNAPKVKGTYLMNENDVNIPEDDTNTTQNTTQKEEVTTQKETKTIQKAKNNGDSDMMSFMKKKEGTKKK